jgi:endonuclease-3
MPPKKAKKRPLDVDLTLDRISQAVKPWPKAAMFELAEKGFDSPFEQLIACIISIRTYDEVSLPTAIRLFEKARTPKQISNLTVEEIDGLIRTSTFHERKAEQIHAIAQRVLEEFDGKLPCDAEAIQSFAGVGPKCTHLVLGVACKEPL